MVNAVRQEIKYSNSRLKHQKTVLIKARKKSFAQIIHCKLIMSVVIDIGILKLPFFPILIGICTKKDAQDFEGKLPDSENVF